MVSQFWASRKEMTQNNGRTRPSDERNNQSEPTNQIANIHLATNNHIRTPQGIPQSSQNHPMVLNNFTQGRHRDNNVADAGTAPMVPFSLSGHNMTSFIPSARYGQILSPSLPSDPQLYMDLNKITPYCAKPVQKSSSNDLGFQGNPQHFPNPYGLNFNNQTNFPHHPYEEGSNRTNNSSLLNDFNPLLSDDLTSLNGAKGDVIPTSNPPPYHLSQRKALDKFCSSGNAGRVSTCDIASISSKINPYQGYTQGFPNYFGPGVHNRNNFRYNPYGEGSSHTNDSSLFNDFNPLLSVDLTSMNGVKGDVIPTSNPPPYHLIQRNALNKFCSPGNPGRVSTCDISSKSSKINPYQGYTQGFPNYFGPGVHNRNNFRYNPYGEGSSHTNDSSLFNNFNPHPSVDLDRLNCEKDTVLPITTPHLDRLRASKSYASDIRDTETWKRLKSFTSPNDCSEAVQSKGKELLLFKDQKNTIPTSSVVETDDDNENVNENLDLELKL